MQRLTPLMIVTSRASFLIVVITEIQHYRLRCSGEKAGETGLGKFGLFQCPPRFFILVVRSYKISSIASKINTLEVFFSVLSGVVWLCIEISLAKGNDYLYGLGKLYTLGVDPLYSHPL